MATCVLKHPVTLNISVEDANDQITAGFDVIEIHRSTNGKTGLFEEITDFDTRVPLAQNQTLYQFVDKNGSPGYFYKFRFRNDTGPVFSSFSSPFQTIDPALEICSIEELKTFYLFGIDLSDDQGKPMPDALFQHYIIQAVDTLERDLDIAIRPLTIETEGDRQDYLRPEYENYIWTELSHLPVIEVNEVKLVLPGEAVVQVFNREWIHIDRWTGQLQLVPGTGTAGTILLGASGAWIPLIYGNNRYIPHVFRTSYRAGFGPPSPGATDPTPGLTGPRSNPDAILDRGVPRDIKHAIGMIAAMGPLNIAGDLIVGAGIASQSISIDGLSQSVATTSSATNAGYGARMISYGKELKDLLPKLRSYYRGIPLQVV